MSKARIAILSAPALLAAPAAAHADTTVAADPAAQDVDALDGTVVWVSGAFGSQRLMQGTAAGTAPVAGAPVATAYRSLDLGRDARGAPRPHLPALPDRVELRGAPGRPARWPSQPARSDPAGLLAVHRPGAVADPRGLRARLPPRHDLPPRPVRQAGRRRAAAPPAARRRRSLRGRRAHGRRPARHAGGRRRGRHLRVRVLADRHGRRPPLVPGRRLRGRRATRTRAASRSAPAGRCGR